ncbi:hypothetical protein [Ruegeria sp. EL01]|jgi:hypothetical protein|uniref:hypothetical protein n=1 Tax=Ruegeria sp. EL01 TaxID=2107578 RepID=UPI000EA82D35|nr:hypothetical protein [Ruegeria sp. EL01]
MTAFAQGEIYARYIDQLPEGLVPFTEKDETGAWIISHSESGHHHVIDAPGVTVMERTTDVPEGMRILYAIVDEPTSLKQNAANAHEAHDMTPGIYEMRISREFDPFLQQARRVAD